MPFYWARGRRGNDDILAGLAARLGEMRPTDPVTEALFCLKRMAGCWAFYSIVYLFSCVCCCVCYIYRSCVCCFFVSFCSVLLLSSSIHFNPSSLSIFQPWPQELLGFEHSGRPIRRLRTAQREWALQKHIPILDFPMHEKHAMHAVQRSQRSAQSRTCVFSLVVAWTVMTMTIVLLFPIT